VSSLHCASGVVSDCDYKRWTLSNKDLGRLCLSLNSVTFKFNLLYLSHRKYELKSILICIIEEELGPKTDHVTSTGIEYTARSCMICTALEVKVRRCIQGFGGET
jgi:hypothetical protein